MISSDLLESVKKHEGLRLKAYQDSEGVWTIGYGTNLQTLTIDKNLADLWLRQKLEEAVREVSSLPCYDTIKNDFVRKDVLIEMIYNLGFNGLMKFKNTIKKINERDWEGAAKEMLSSKWASQVGGRAQTLAARMRTGEY